MAKSKEKQIQIPISLFMDICRYFLLDQAEPELAASISKGIDEKFKRIKENELYTLSKTASTEEKREENRKKYLDSKGIKNEFRW